MKLLNIFIIIALLLSCGEQGLNKIHDYNIQSIEIYNRSRDTSISNNITIRKQSQINEFVDLMLASKKTIDYNVKANIGFIEIVFILKNRNRMSMSYVFTNHGEVLLFEGKCYLNPSIINYIKEEY